MTTSYPGAIDEFADKINNFDEVMAEDINNLQDSVAAIEGELGVEPKGGYGSVADRLDILGEVIGDVTKTVGSGKDFATIQEAINWFKGKILKGTNIISVDPGTYNENLLIDDYYASKSTNLQIIGDIRECAGAWFAHQCPIYYGGNRGSGICTLSVIGSDISVVGSTTNPDFAALGVVSGDKIVAIDSAGVSSEVTVSSVAGNTITLSTAAPAINADGAGFIILPNRRVVSPATPTSGVIYVRSASVTIQGFTVHSPSAYSSACVLLDAAIGNVDKLVTLGGSGGLVCWNNSLLGGSRLSSASFDSPGSYRSGLSGSRGSNISARYSFAMGNNGNHRGFTAQSGCTALDSRYSVAISLGEGFGTYDGAQYLDAHFTYARKINTTGYNSNQFSYIGALSTVDTTTVIGAGVKHNPAISGTFNSSAATCIFS